MSPDQLKKQIEALEAKTEELTMENIELTEKVETLEEKNTSLKIQKEQEPHVKGEKVIVKIGKDEYYFPYPQVSIPGFGEFKSKTLAADKALLKKVIEEFPGIVKPLKEEE